MPSDIASVRSEGFEVRFSGTSARIKSKLRFGQRSLGNVNLICMPYQCRHNDLYDAGGISIMADTIQKEDPTEGFYG